MSEKVGVGDVLAGKYRVEKVLGSGGMGVVVAARHLQLDVLVALKFMADDALREPDLVARFLREGRAAARLRSEHVARVTDVGTLDWGAPYQVMEYLEGSDLSELLSSEGPQSIPSAVEYIVQACEALDEAHGAGIVHRDIKPSNLFLTKRPNGTACVKVLDFGISKSDRLGGSSAKLHATHARAVLGSPFYMAPEQMRAAREVDARADIWALGATLYELLTGRVPFDADSLLDLALQVAQAEPVSIRDIRVEVPWALEQVVLRCLEKDREDRFASVRMLAGALAPFAQRWSAALRGVAPRAAWSEDTGVESSRDTLVDSSADAVTRVARAPVASEDDAESERPTQEPASLPAAHVDDTTGPSEGNESAPSARTTFRMPAIELPPRLPAERVAPKAQFASPLGSVPPVAQSVLRGWRTGGRQGWGRSQKLLGKSARAAWGVAAVATLCGAAGVAFVRSPKPSGNVRELTPASLAVNAPMREPLVSGAAIDASAGAPPLASSAASESATRIPTFSVNDLPTAPMPVISASVYRPAEPPVASSIPTAGPTKPSCAEPYYFDMQGHKKFKIECLESSLSAVASTATRPHAPARDAGPTPTGSPSHASDPLANPHAPTTL
jgi:serine/threonine protein kinase